MQQFIFHLDGLTCGACKKISEKRIASIPGVVSVDVTVATGSALIQSEQVVTDTHINDALTGTPYATRR